MLRVLPALALAASSASPSRSQAPAPGLAELWRARSFVAAQASSWDRSGANVDHGNFEETRPDGQRVLAQLPGRGRITRIWSANPTGILRLADGNGTVLYDGPFAALFDGTHDMFPPPLAGQGGGGFTSYVPISFEKGLLATLRAEAEGADVDCYYHVGYELYPDGEPVPASRAARSLLAGHAWSNADRQYILDDRKLHRAADVLDLRGAGMIRELRIRLRNATPAHLRGIRAEIRFDEAKRPAVLAPLGDLFGVAYDGAGIQTQAQTGVGGWRALRFPMPFRKRAVMRLTVEDESLSPLHFDFWTTFRSLPSIPADLTYFHAGFAMGRTVRGQPFRVADIQGRGHFVGTYCVLESEGQGLGFLEGDERIVVDDQLRFRGTGTEDYFSGAWYFRHGPFARPYYAVSVKDTNQGRIVASRLHVPDPIPFAEHLVFELEHGGVNDRPGCRYAALSFWYADDPAGPAVELPSVLVRRFAPLVPRLAFEFEELAGGRAFTQVLPEREMELSGGAVLSLSANTKRTLVVPTIDPGRYLVWLRMAQSEHEATGRLDFLGAAYDIRVPPGGGTEELRVGTVDLPGGESQLEVQGKEGTLLFDRLRFERYRDSIRHWWIVGPFPSPKRVGFDKVFGPERGIEFDREYYDVIGEGSKKWRRYGGPDLATGYIDLDRVFLPNDEVVAYALSVFESSVPREATLYVGSDDGVKAWLNGELVLSHKVVRGAAPDQEVVKVKLKKGRNRLLLKIEESGGLWGFFARIE